MKFDQQRYRDEMRTLVESAKTQFRDQHPDVIVYTISIWTDPDAAASAVNFDTRQHATEQLQASNDWGQKYHDQYMADGDVERARQFTPLPLDGRNTNPADFAYPLYAEIQHQSFPEGWEQDSDGACWDVLEPALRHVGESARVAFAELLLHPEAELGVNSRHDWYDEAWPLLSAD